MWSKSISFEVRKRKDRKIKNLDCKKRFLSIFYEIAQRKNSDPQECQTKIFSAVKLLFISAFIYIINFRDFLFRGKPVDLGKEIPEKIDILKSTPVEPSLPPRAMVSCMLPW